jgi:putative addiction module CopG family antidote
MPSVQFDIPEELDRFIASKVADGAYQSASEVIEAALRTLEREEQEYQTKLAALRNAIDVGDASGIAEGDVFADIREELGLPPRRR